MECEGTIFSVLLSCEDKFSPQELYIQETHLVESRYETCTIYVRSLTNVEKRNRPFHSGAGV